MANASKQYTKEQVERLLKVKGQVVTISVALCFGLTAHLYGLLKHPNETAYNLMFWLVEVLIILFFAMVATFSILDMFNLAGTKHQDDER